MWEKIKNILNKPLFKEITKSPLHDEMEELRKIINENNPIIEKWIKDNWYVILCRDTRLFFYSYTLAKKDDLMTKKIFYLWEMIEFINLTK